MARFPTLLAFCFTLSTFFSQVLTFAPYASLAGLSDEELAKVIPTLKYRRAPPPPGPLKDTSAKLVADDDHPYIAPGPNDIRGPCPGLNTLANHGYIPRNGIASPTDLINGAQAGFNMGLDFASFLVYIAHIVDGNLITDLLSIGKSSTQTGAYPQGVPYPGGLNQHGTFEGDASMTRGDAHFGDNWSFNQTLFDNMFKYDLLGNFNPVSAALHRYARWNESKATNPEFTYTDVRFATAYAESVAVYTFFTDPLMRVPVPTVTKDYSISFFRDGKFPDGYIRTFPPVTIPDVGLQLVTMQAAIPLVVPGRNAGGVNTYVPDITSPPNDILYCELYSNYINKVVLKLYPNPTGVLRQSLQRNLQFLYLSLGLLAVPCIEQFPYGIPLPI